MGEVGGFSPLYAAETEHSSAEAGTSERNMEFVRRTILSAKVQDVVDQQAVIGCGSGRRRGVLLGQAVAVVLMEGGRSWLVQASLGRPCKCTQGCPKDP